MGMLNAGRYISLSGFTLAGSGGSHTRTAVATGAFGVSDAATTRRLPPRLAMFAITPASGTWFHDVIAGTPFEAAPFHARSKASGLAATLPLGRRIVDVGGGTLVVVAAVVVVVAGVAVGVGGGAAGCVGVAGVGGVRAGAVGGVGGGGVGVGVAAGVAAGAAVAGGGVVGAVVAGGVVVASVVVVAASVVVTA